MSKHYKQITSVEEFELIFAELDERETVINIDSMSETAQLYTSDNKMLTKLKARFKECPESFTVYEAGRDLENRVTGYFFHFHRDLINIMAKKRTCNRAPMSEEQKAKLFGRG